MTPSLSLTGKRWILRTEHGAPQETDAILSMLRSVRALDGTIQSAACYPQMGKAVERIRTAIGRREKIGIFGDYDCDGVTASAQLIRFFHRRSVTPVTRLPHRVRDGYGLGPHIVDEWKQSGITLLITVDTGISAIQEITRLQEAGIDVIVTDHHHVPADIPPAYAIIHPALAPGMPAPHPSGAGVAFRLIEALEGGEWEDRDTDLALAMIGTVADLVELRGENRALVMDGLAALERLTGGPLAALREHVRVKRRKLTSTDIAFRIAPRINAAGRMAEPMIALNALLGDMDALRQLDALNSVRQSETASLVEHARNTLIRSNTDDPFIFLARPEYPHGILGLIAGRITESTGRPSLAACIDGDVCTASLRSPEAYHVTQGLHRCADLLLRYGGHAQAAGCTFLTSALPALRERLIEDVRSKTQPDALLPTIMIDALISPKVLSLDLCRNLQSLEPFGSGNPEPRFLLHNVQIEHLRQVGADGNHLQGRIDGIKLIGFSLAHLAPSLKEPVDIVCRLGTDAWNGVESPQVFVEDVALAQWAS